MTQPTPSIDELLTNDKAYPVCPPQTPDGVRPSNPRDLLAREIQTRLDAAGTVACCLCHHQRPRKRPDEPYYYLSDECKNVRQPWHYHRTFRSKKADDREGRRHRRRLRKGRVNRVTT